MLKLSCDFRSRIVCVMTESENSSDRSSRPQRNLIRAPNGRGRYHSLLPIGYSVLCNWSNLSDQHSPPAIFASASHVPRLDATQAWGPHGSWPGLVPVLGCPSARLCDALFSGLLGFWASISPALLGNRPLYYFLGCYYPPPLLFPNCCPFHLASGQGQEPKHSPFCLLSSSKTFLSSIPP
jgi:hypothetical protein